MNNSIILVVTMALVTMLLRFLPFIVLKDADHTPALITHLGNVLPAAAIGMLVVYCLRDTELTNMSSLIPAASASIVTVLVQAKWKNVIYSVIGGTAVYMILLHLF